MSKVMEENDVLFDHILMCGEEGGLNESEITNALMENQPTANYVNLKKNYTNSDGIALGTVSPLLLALEKEHIKIAKALLELKDENGITLVTGINDSNNRGETALTIASEFGYDEIVIKLLERQDVNVNLANVDRETPLIKACRSVELGIVEELLKKNADVNWIDNSNQTVLHIACSAGDDDFAEACVAELLKVDGIDVNIVDQEGKTPIDIVEGWRDNIKELLETYTNTDNNNNDNSPRI